MPWFATRSYQSFLPEANTPFPMQYGPEPFGREIFGHSINLGLQIGKIKEYVLDNFDEVKKHLSKLDGSQKKGDLKNSGKRQKRDCQGAC